ncbi:MAG: DUF1810 domain-containing protein [Mycobacteriaceae bacterium]|nr:DUF1810 domain-containing protein [Mycobacteriaceae bacterium]
MSSLNRKDYLAKLAEEGAVGKLFSSDRADPYDLQRFVEAQDRVYDTALTELRDGRKRSHWIWFVFPQIQGLGSSPTAMRYGITSLAEAKAYLDHEVLGSRLRECCRIVAGIQGASADDIFGWPDNMKVRSSMTLFARAAESAEVQADFRAVLDRFYGGLEDELTVERLAT